jgi:hypothetical protein
MQPPSINPTITKAIARIVILTPVPVAPASTPATLTYTDFHTEYPACTPVTAAALDYLRQQVLQECRSPFG